MYQIEYLSAREAGELHCAFGVHIFVFRRNERIDKVFQFSHLFTNLGDSSSSCAEVMVCYFKRVTIITFSFTDTENFFPVSAATTEAALRMLLGKYFGVLGISIESPTTKALILPLTLILVCVSIFIRIFVSLLTMQISAILLIYQIILLIF